MFQYTVITNNPLIKENQNEESYKFISGNFLDVLIECRDCIHKGHKLLSHPLSSSLKPNETPYKSVIISKEIYKLDYESLEIIESSILTTKKFIKDKKQNKLLPANILEDFMLIDFSIISSAIESIT